MYERPDIGLEWFIADKYIILEILIETVLY